MKRGCLFGLFFAFCLTLNAEEGLRYLHFKADRDLFEELVQADDQQLGYGIDFCKRSPLCQRVDQQSMLSANPSIYLLQVNPNLCAIKVVKAVDDGIGRETVLSLSQRHQAIAGVNGGYFEIGGTFDGLASGALKAADWYALPRLPRACLAWSKQDTSPLFDRVLATLICRHEANTYRINGINRERKEKEAILFNHAFHRSTLTKPDGEELVIIDGRVIKVVKGMGSTIIPNGGYVLSIQQENPLYGRFSVGTQLEFDLRAIPQIEHNKEQDWNQKEYILGGTPLLIHQGRVISDYRIEATRQNFLEHRHARTAVGLLPNGDWLFLVADRTGLFDGLTIPQLAHLMHRLGCIEAMNLDGGGSSTMVYQNRVINEPHGDEDEDQGTKMLRRVSDAVLITPLAP